jgi:hypothetical protein
MQIDSELRCCYLLVKKSCHPKKWKSKTCFHIPNVRNGGWGWSFFPEKIFSLLNFMTVSFL